MIKRIIPLVAVLALLVALFVVPASATDYDTKTDFRFDIQFNDTSGNTSVSYLEQSGDINLDFAVNNYGSVNIDQYYGFWLDTTAYLYDGSFIANKGSRVAFELSGINVYIADEELSYYDFFQTFEFSVVLYFSDGSSTVIRDGLTVVYNTFAHCLVFSGGFDVDKPITAMKFALFGSPSADLGYAPGYTSDVYFTMIGRPIMLVSTEIIPDQNDKLDQIINGTVTPEPPAGSDSVGDLDDIEGGLKDDTAAGREEAEEIFNESSGLVASHISGFLFLSNVIERFMSVGWLRGILVISLSLGILGFLANIAMIAGRNGRDGRDARSSKGG